MVKISIQMKEEARLKCILCAGLQYTLKISTKQQGACRSASMTYPVLLGPVLAVM